MMIEKVMIGISIERGARGTGDAEDAGSHGQKPTGKAEDAKSRSQQAAKSHNAKKPPETGNAEDAKSQSRKSRINPTKSRKSQTERNSKDQEAKGPRDQRTTGPGVFKEPENQMTTKRTQNKSSRVSLWKVVFLIAKKFVDG